MKNYDEIKSIITQKLGFTDLAKYQAVAYAPERRKTPLSQEELDILSPDNVNNTDFWRVADELFGTDPVCNQKAPTPNIISANRQNLQLARLSGVLGWADAAMGFFRGGRVLEVGPGYGNFRSHIEVNWPSVEYFAVDTVPRTNDVRVAAPDGTIPRQLVVDGMLSMIYSSNVFQHLSAKQRSQYYKDASVMLTDNGAFIFNLLTVANDYKATEGAFDENGRAYLGHYGQWTVIPTFAEVIAELRENDFDLYSHQIRAGDGLTSFFAMRKPRPEQKKEETNASA